MGSANFGSAVWTSVWVVISAIRNSPPPGSVVLPGGLPSDEGRLSFADRAAVLFMVLSLAVTAVFLAVFWIVYL